MPYATFSSWEANVVLSSTMVATYRLSEMFNNVQRLFIVASSLSYTLLVQAEKGAN